VRGPRLLAAVIAAALAAGGALLFWRLRAGRVAAASAWRAQIAPCSSPRPTPPTTCGGDAIVVVRDAKLILHRADGTEQALVTGPIEAPRCDPSGDHVVFVRAGDVYVVDRVERLRALTNDHHAEAGAIFTADGKSVVFAATRDGTRALHEISAVGGPERQLATGGGSPELAGDRLVFVDAAGACQEITNFAAR
jgi:hypothetical protein